MSRMIMCSRLKREAKGLDVPPFPGPLGEEIFENVSEEAWAEWKDMQVKIINEYRLDLSEFEHRQTLLQQMRTFLGLPGTDASSETMHVGTPRG